MGDGVRTGQTICVPCVKKIKRRAKRKAKQANVTKTTNAEVLIDTPVIPPPSLQCSLSSRSNDQIAQAKGRVSNTKKSRADARQDRIDRIAWKRRLFSEPPSPTLTCDTTGNDI